MRTCPLASFLHWLILFHKGCVLRSPGGIAAFYTLRAPFRFSRPTTYVGAGGADTLCGEAVVPMGMVNEEEVSCSIRKLKAQLRACQTRLDEEQGIIEGDQGGCRHRHLQPGGIIQEASPLPGP